MVASQGLRRLLPARPVGATDVDPSDLLLESRVNGEVRQSARTSDMLFDPYELVSFVSSVMTLVPGDVVLTGTPGGIGPLDVGDTSRCASRVSARSRTRWSSATSRRRAL